jgi:predicted transcriptional regulator of viral defense system
MLPWLFRNADAEKVGPHTGMFLSRAVQKGFLHRLNRGNYINSFLYGYPGVEEVACFLRPPAYISCEWALNYHGVSLQSPSVCTVITLSTSVGKKRDIEYRGVVIQFSRIAPSLYFGFNCNDRFCMASAEKAILDTLYYRGAIPAGDELELDAVDLKRLPTMAARYPAAVSRALKGILGR